MASWCHPAAASPNDQRIIGSAISCGPILTSVRNPGDDDRCVHQSRMAKHCRWKRRSECLEDVVVQALHVRGRAQGLFNGEEAAGR